MTQLKRFFFGVAILVAIGFIGSQSALADCAGSSSVIANATTVRSEDAAELLGSITITCSAGVVAAPSTITISLNNVNADTHVGSSVQPAAGSVYPPATPLTPTTAPPAGAAQPTAGAFIPPNVAPAGSTLLSGWTSACLGTGASTPDFKTSFPCPSLASTAAPTVVAAPGTSSCAIGATGAAAGSCPGPSGSIVTVSAKTIQFQFIPTAAAQSFYIVGIRANIGGLAAGTPVTATVTVEGGIGNRSNSNVVLGVVQQVLATTGTGFTGTSTLSITACGPAIRTPIGTPTTVAANPDPAGTTNSLRVSFAEGSLGAWTAAGTADSQVYASGATAPAPAAGTQGTRFRVLLTNIPTGMQVYAPETISAASAATTGAVSAGGLTVITLVTGAATDGSGGTVLTGAVANQFDLLTPTGGQVAVTYEVTTAPATTALDTVTVFLALTGTGPTGTGQVTGLASLAPVAPPTNASLPQFIAGKGATVANVVACVSYLLFPWAVVDGTYDTGLAIANTTADPTAIGTTAQAGDVTLFFFPTNLSDSSPAASFSQTISPTGGLKGGAVATFDLNSLKTKPFYGYIIAVCNFTLAHGFAFIDTPNAGPATVAQGYIAVVINNPRIGSTNPVEAGGR